MSSKSEPVHLLVHLWVRADSFMYLLARGKKDKWVKEYQGQLLISTGAIQWTNDCSKALNAISGGNKTALKALKKKQVTCSFAQCRELDLHSSLSTFEVG